MLRYTIICFLALVLVFTSTMLTVHLHQRSDNYRLEQDRMLWRRSKDILAQPPSPYGRTSRENAELYIEQLKIAHPDWQD